MSDTPALYDKRSEFFKGCFNKGLGFEDYISSGTPRQREKWLGFYEKISLTEEQKNLVSGFIREINVLVMSGIWCGDCARQGPMIRKIEEASPRVKVRFIDNGENPELQEELRISGGSRVPVVVSLSEDFFEMGRFGDRHLSVYRKKALNELGPACDAGLVPPNDQELSTELSEWVDYFERIHLMLRLSPFLRTRHND